MIVAQSPAAARDRRRRGHLRDRDGRGRPRGAAGQRSRRGHHPRRPPRLVTNAYEAKRVRPLLASGVVLHVLPAGAAFDLTTRQLRSAGRAGRSERGRRRAGRGQADLRQMARDIAAGDRSPATLRRRLARKRAPRKTVPTTDPPTHSQPATSPSRTEHRGDRAPDPGPHDHGDPRLPRPQHLVLRQGDPPGGRPRRARGVPDRHAPRLHRAPARGAPRPRATTPARAAARAASSSGCTRAPGSATSPSTSRWRCSRSSATTSGAARPAR